MPLSVSWSRERLEAGRLAPVLPWPIVSGLAVTDSGPDTATTLELTGVDATYGGAPVLRTVDLRVRRSEMVALIGPNGAGKSTLLRVAGATLRPSAGSARLLGRDLRDLS